MRKDLVAEYYKRHHAGEGGFRRYGFTIGGDERTSWLGERVGAGRKVLDLGCRDGTLTSSFLAGNQVTGIDVDDDALAEARRRFGFETLKLNLNQEPLPFPDESFDVVVAGEILEHLQFPDVAVADVRRVLRKGGLFAGSVPNAFRLRNRIKFLMGEDFELDPTHLHQFSPTSLRKLLAGFACCEIDFIARSSRYAWIPRRLMGKVMTWICVK